MRSLTTLLQGARFPVVGDHTAHVSGLSVGFAALVLIAVAAACGSEGRKSNQTTFQNGRAVFERSCFGCHTLTGHVTPASGGDLAIAKLNVRDVASFTRIMPVKLSNAQVVAVATYVHAVAEEIRKR